MPNKIFIPIEYLDNTIIGLHGTQETPIFDVDFEDYEEEVIEEYRKSHPNTFDSGDYDYDDF